MTEQLRFLGSDGEGRDVVQPRRERQNHPRQVARLSGLVQKVQRYRGFEPERPGPGAPQHRDMAHRAQRQRNVTREAADVGALGDGGREGDGLTRSCRAKSRHPAKRPSTSLGTNGQCKTVTRRVELDLDPRPRQRISPLPIHLERRVGGGHLSIGPVKRGRIASTPASVGR